MFGIILSKILTSAITQQVAANVAVALLEKAVTKTDNDIDDIIVQNVKTAFNAKKTLVK